MTLPQILLYPVWIMGVGLLASDGILLRSAETLVSLRVCLRYIVCNICHDGRLWIQHELSEAASLFCHLVWAE